MNVEERLEIERRIVRELCERAIKQTWHFHYNDGEAIAVPITQSIDAVMEHVHSTDEAYITFFDGSTRVLTAMLVYGNDGYDVIGDYSWPKSQEEMALAFQDEMSAWIDTIEAEGNSK